MALGDSLAVKTPHTAASSAPSPQICESGRGVLGLRLRAIGDVPRGSGVSEAGRISDYDRLRAGEEDGKDLRAKEGCGEVHMRAPDPP